MQRKRYYYLIEVQYLGFRYHGWQKQPKVKTVQGMINRTIAYVLGHHEFRTLGAGRTDAMVSANSTAFELFTREPLEINEFFQQLDLNLPSDIKALNIKEVDADFNVIHSPKQKEYLYLFSFGQKNHPFAAPYMVYMRDSLNIPLMQEGAKIFEGTHNFLQFCVKPSPDTELVRTVDRSEIVPNDVYTASFFPEENYLFRVIGKGFLRYQIRLMMGTLFALGRGVITLDNLKGALTGEYWLPQNFIAPPSGLILQSVEYD